MQEGGFALSGSVDDRSVFDDVLLQSLDGEGLSWCQWKRLGEGSRGCWDLRHVVRAIESCLWCIEHHERDCGDEENAQNSKLQPESRGRSRSQPSKKRRSPSRRNRHNGVDSYSPTPLMLKIRVIDGAHDQRIKRSPSQPLKDPRYHALSVACGYIGVPCRADE